MKSNDQLRKIYIALYNKVRAKAEYILTTTPTIDHLYRFNKYYEYLNWLSEEIVKLGGKEIKIISPTLQEAYLKNRGYSQNQFFQEVDIDRVWCSDGKRWSDRIWSDKNKLKEVLSQGLVDCVSRGATTDDLTKQLMKDCSTSYNNAIRLVRTEVIYEQNRGQLDKFIADGIEQIKILEPNDARTCEHCKENNGKVLNINDVILGVNAPPYHPNCRGTIQAII